MDDHSISYKYEFDQQPSRSSDSDRKERVRQIMNEKYGLRTAEGIPLHESLESAYKKMNTKQRRQQANVHYDKGEYKEALFYCDKLISGDLKDASLWSLRGNLMYALCNYVEAMAAFGEGIKLKPKSDIAWQERGIAQRKSHFFEEAIQDLNEAIRLNPKSDIAYRERGTAKRKLGHYKEAISDLNLAVKMNPQSDLAWVERGATKRSLGSNEEAIQDLNEAVKLNPKNDVAWRRRGTVKHLLGRNEEAIQDLNEALKLNPKSAGAWRKRGIAKSKLGFYAEAIRDFDEAIKLINGRVKTESNRGIVRHINDDVVWSERGVANYKLKHYEEAIKDLNKAKELNGDNCSPAGLLRKAKLRLKNISVDSKEAFTSQYLGSAKRMLGHYEDAIKELNKAIELSPTSGFAWLERGAAKRQLNRCEDAIRDLNEAIKLDPKNAVAWEERGAAKNKMKRYEEAIQDLNEALRLDPKSAVACRSRGAAKNRLGRYEEAIQDLNEALKLDSKSAFAWEQRGAAKHKLGRHEEAIQDLSEALKLKPKSAFAWRSRGAAKHKLGRHEEAIEDLNEAIKLDPKNGRALQELGDAKRQLGRYEEAIQDLSKALELELGNVDIENKIAELRKEKELSQKLEAELDELQAKEDYEAQRYAEAISCCDKVLAVKPENLKILQIRGESHAKLNHHREAIQDFDKIILLDPINDTALVYRGVARQSLGQNKEAVDDLTKAIALNASLDYAWMFRGVAQQALGCFEESFEDLSEAVRLNPESNFAHKKLKEVKGVLINGWKNKATQHYKTKEYTETIFYCDKVILENPEDVTMLQLCGESKLKQGRYKDAIQDLMEVMRLNPENTYVKECLKEARRNLKDESQASTSALPPKLSATSQDSPVFSHVIKFSMTIPKEQLVFEQIIGEGSFGIVYKGVWSPTSLFSVPVAIKQLKKTSMSAKLLEDFKREVEVQAKLNSVGVVKLLGITAEQPYCMVMEFMEQGSLRDVLDRQKPEEILWSVRIQMAITMAEGLSYLHDQNPIIIHGDLKSLNILVNGKGEAKLADFGLAALKTETRSREYVEGNAEKNKGPKGSLLWIAPELFRMNAKRTPATDVFSFAVVLWELASHLFPYESAYGDSHRIQDWVEKGERESFDERTPNTPKEYSDLTQRCWDGKPENRPSAKSIVVELEALYASTPLAPTLFSSGAQPLSPKVPVKKPATVNSGGYLVKSANPLTKSKTGSPKVPPRKSLVGSGNYLVKSATSSSTSSPTSSPQVPPKSPYLGNVYK